MNFSFEFSSPFSLIMVFEIEIHPLITVKGAIFTKYLSISQGKGGER